MDDVRTLYRSLVYSGDGPGLLQALQVAWPEFMLQYVGDGLLAALALGVEGAPDAAERCIAALLERDWDGDSELADEIERALGRDPAESGREYRELQSVPVDLDEIASRIEGDPLSGEAFLDADSGVVTSREGLIDFGADDMEIERLVNLGHLGSRPGYRDMEFFIEQSDDPDFADRLWIAISGRGAFRRFKDVLARDSDRLEEYYMFSDERQRGRARVVLAESGLKPAVVVKDPPSSS